MATSLPRLSIISTPCDPDDRRALVSEFNRQLCSSRLDPSVLLVYCDGSRMRCKEGCKKRTGFGPVGYYMGRKVFSLSVGLGPRATVYDAELLALAHASSKAEAFVLGKPHIGEVSFSDSSSALRSVFDPSTHPDQRCSLVFRRSILDMFGRHVSLRITASWSPGHSGVVGNKVTDTSAKKGSKLPSMTRDSTYSHLKHRVRMRAQLPWRRQWTEDSPKPGSFVLADVVPPSIAPNKTFKNTPRELFSRVIQTITSHDYTREYYQRFVPTESPWCKCTDKVPDPTLQTKHYIICECPRYEAFCKILRKNHPNLYPISCLASGCIGLQIGLPLARV